MNGEMMPKDHYKAPSGASIYNRVLKIHELKDKFCQIFDIKPDSLFVNITTLKEIMIRIDQRKVYFKIYHDCFPNEQKKTALLVYWILKLRPFWLPIDENDNSERLRFAAHINEAFCVFLTLSVLIRVNDGKLPSSVNKNFIREVSYSFRYRELSKESLYLLFDCIHN